LELQYLLETKRIETPPARIIHELALSINLAVCEQPFDAIIAPALRLKWTRDPFDRIITASAIARRCRLITKDSVIRAHFEGAYWK
jgi:PIN domain nuclease of toxin-antitoxin system